MSASIPSHALREQWRKSAYREGLLAPYHPRGILARQIVVLVEAVDLLERQLQRARHNAKTWRKEAKALAEERDDLARSEKVIGEAWDREVEWKREAEERLAAVKSLADELSKKPTAWQVISADPAVQIRQEVAAQIYAAIDSP